jgi:hypothetical protein
VTIEAPTVLKIEPAEIVAEWTFGLELKRVSAEWLTKLPDTEIVELASEDMSIFCAEVSVDAKMDCVVDERRLDADDT